MQRVDCNLRPIEERDLATVLGWRNSERVRSYMYTDHVISPDEHHAWFTRLSGDPFPTVLIFEYRGTPVGLKNFTQIDRRNNRCYWGFYLGEADLPRGCGTAMGFLALEYIFERQQLRKLCAEAFAFNDGSVKYHTRLGFRQEGRYLQHVLKNGVYEDIVSFALFRDDWLAGKTILENTVFR
ncbi:spermidine N(1)-acetyltransferase [Geobacter sp. OR-1]|uniref:UDP-4-amino-4, 6-dideoxy-N-acetyl-beta-L-altrosamine N-acetyltransferase n=1 Tax=Geobacter sp. OR-1 TaxID=1266765 RepID=UPI000541F3AC|nr:UDP-4-amino-4,6-dideoxy-N-acetyl-beta-L-altrosamine N-acetyltransferase [Geobacter sp. OR-1]GAM09646.1 spermidine N(1)-acetyltransferase [Geobacter sp. OR-1]